jgi:hypothetical protein
MTKQTLEVFKLSHMAVLAHQNTIKAKKVGNLYTTTK